MSIAVFDVDGVVADVRHRLHLIERRPKDWSAFFAAAADDPGLREGISRVLEAVTEHEVVWLTGRPNSLRSVTRRWLAGHGLPVSELIMRTRLPARAGAQAGRTGQAPGPAGRAVRRR